MRCARPADVETPVAGRTIGRCPRPPRRHHDRARPTAHRAAHDRHRRRGRRDRPRRAPHRRGAPRPAGGDPPAPGRLPARPAPVARGAPPPRRAARPARRVAPPPAPRQRPHRVDHRGRRRTPSGRVRLAHRPELDGGPAVARDPERRGDPARSAATPSGRACPPCSRPCRSTSQEACRDLRAEHAADATLLRSVERHHGPEVAIRLRRANPPVSHPLVRTHPVTGEALLFLSPLYLRRLIGIERRQGDRMLRELNGLLEDPHVQVRWRWAGGRRRDLGRGGHLPPGAHRPLPAAADDAALRGAGRRPALIAHQSVVGMRRPVVTG